MPSGAVADMENTYASFVYRKENAITMLTAPVKQLSDLFVKDIVLWSERAALRVVGERAQRVDETVVPTVSATGCLVHNPRECPVYLCFRFW